MRNRPEEIKQALYQLSGVADQIKQLSNQLYSIEAGAPLADAKKHLRMTGNEIAEAIYALKGELDEMEA